MIRRNWIGRQGRLEPGGPRTRFPGGAAILAVVKKRVPGYRFRRAKQPVAFVVIRLYRNQTGHLERAPGIASIDGFPQHTGRQGVNDVRIRRGNGQFVDRDIR